MVLGQLLGIITHAGTATKLSWGILTGKGLFPKENQADSEQRTLNEAKKRIDANNSKELKSATSNDWSKNPVIENPFFYKEVGINRVSKDNTRFMITTVAVLGIIVGVLLYILNSKFRKSVHRELRGGAQILSIFKNKRFLKIFTAIVVPIIIIGLIYLYIHLNYGVNQILLIRDCTPRNQTVEVDVEKISLPKDGVNWSYNMWIYIQDWAFNNGNPKVFLSKPNSMKMQLGAETPTVKLDIYTDSDKYESIEISKFCEENDLCADGLDIERWNMITVTVNSKNIRFYHNGKLILGKKLEGLPKLGDSVMTVGKGAGSGKAFHGRITNLKFIKHTLDQGEVDRLYREKPDSALSKFSNIF
tara:strand:- start:147 stop:1226 length:1080 start_codon:yes stop_codon:yes gene_type:complete